MFLKKQHKNIILMRGKTGISVVVPAYNEEKLITANSERLAKFLDSKGLDFEIILSDNGSTDKTLEKEKALEKKDSRIVAASSEMKGIGIGVKKGVSVARFENIVFFPIDLSFNLSFITDAAGILDEGKADIIIGSKGAKGSRVKRPFSRRAFSFIYGLLLNLLFGLGIKDTTGTLAFRKSRAGKEIAATEANDAFVAAEFLINARRKGLRIIEIPIVAEDLRKDSKMVPFRDGFKMLLQIIRKRFG